ncbi:SOS response-associated peptidase [Paenibacillus kobensis]|uniref:SOS response-associated peptidase n=1 Tax=Paenibacillus kobensis TaxID=59841 RepID=UPI000FD868FC|nr:SOS response-associated peptidase [Paenibacillus kobensis]
MDRFALKSDITQVADQFKVWAIKKQVSSRLNIAPTQSVTIIMNDRLRQRAIEEARWGLYPFWAKDSINADGERVGSKRYFNRMLNSRRCVVPCTGFFGWKQEESVKEPSAMHIVVDRRPLFGMAGIYDAWTNPKGVEERAFTILTMPASGPMAAWQQRLPVILDEEGVEAWLNPELADYNQVRTFVQPLEPFQLRAYPVTSAVVDERYEAPDCVLDLGLGTV